MYIDCEIWYPIEYSVLPDGRVEGCAELFGHQEEASMTVATTCRGDRSGFAELARVLRAWVHGRQVVIAGANVDSLPGDLVIAEPLAGPESQPHAPGHRQREAL